MQQILKLPRSTKLTTNQTNPVLRIPGAGDLITKEP